MQIQKIQEGPNKASEATRQSPRASRLTLASRNEENNNNARRDCCQTPTVAESLDFHGNCLFLKIRGRCDTTRITKNEMQVPELSITENNNTLFINRPPPFHP